MVSGDLLRASGLALLVVAGCGGGASGNFPERPDVTQAEAGWCKALAKIQGKEEGWEHMAECKAFRTTASAAYLRGMTKCFFSRLESLGDSAPDQTQIATECNDEVTLGLPADDLAGRDVITARCERMQRCEKVTSEDCRAGVEKLESAQRALFTTTYNSGALRDVADCLSSKSCSDNEEAARDACYKPAADKLLYFPG